MFETRIESNNADEFMLICWDYDNNRAMHLREGLLSQHLGKHEATSVVDMRLPLVFEHYHKDVYLVQRDVARSFPRSFYEMRAEKCEEFGEFNPSLEHDVAALQWAYLVSRGSFGDFPAYLVSPGVLLYSNYSSGTLVQSRHMADQLDELLHSAQECLKRGSGVELEVPP
jgi:hypothetical protein